MGGVVVLIVVALGVGREDTRPTMGFAAFSRQAIGNALAITGTWPSPHSGFSSLIHPSTFAGLSCEIISADGYTLQIAVFVPSRPRLDYRVGGPIRLLPIAAAAVVSSQVFPSSDVSAGRQRRRSRAFAGRVQCRLGRCGDASEFSLQIHVTCTPYCLKEYYVSPAHVLA